ncbi:MAG TPA: hypothetical protein VL282_11320 [Tepidisphaeraceae bacterium]|nr:hypothetical protein [Tepidisphaeraceae bacterium]
MNADFRRALGIFLASLAIYAYFFQGGGYNQNAQLDTARALAEHGTFDISRYTTDRNNSLTYSEDVNRAHGRALSNKPPGLAIWVAPVYWILDRIPSLSDHTKAWLATIWGSGVPSAVLAALIYLQIRRMEEPPRRAMVFAGAWAFGSLAFPYSGLLMSHALLATCVFGMWMLLKWEGEAPSDPNVDSRKRLARSLALPAEQKKVTATFSGKRWLTPFSAGALAGLALANWQPLAPVLLIPIIAFLVRRDWRSALAFTLGPLLAGLGMLLYQWHYFGSPWETGDLAGQSIFHHQGMLFGRFTWPEWQRLYWLSFHPYRGLFYCCPLFVLSLLALLTREGWRLIRREIFALVIVLSFVLFYLTFEGWHGGWSMGPRYFLPALPFLFLLVPIAVRRFRVPGAILIVASIELMLMTSLVRVQNSGANTGPPLPEDPIAENLRRLTFGEVAKSPESSNLGLQLGLHGPWSVIPPAVVIVGFFCICLRVDADRYSDCSGR